MFHLSVLLEFIKDVFARKKVKCPSPTWKLSVGLLCSFETHLRPLCVLLGGPGLPEVRVGHRHPGRHLPGDQEDVFRQVLQGGRQLQWRGLDHAEGGLQAEGKSSGGFCSPLVLSFYLTLSRSPYLCLCCWCALCNRKTKIGRQKRRCSFPAIDLEFDGASVVGNAIYRYGIC